MSLVAEVHKNHMVVNGIPCFRGNAQSCEVGTFGLKKKPLFGVNHLEPQGRIPWSSLIVDKVTEIKISFEKSSEVNVQAGLTVASSGLSGEAALKQLKRGELKLAQFEVLPDNLERTINKLPRVLDSLRECGNMARVVHVMYVVLQAEFVETFERSGGVSFEETGKSIKLSARGSGSTTIEISEGSVFAYLTVAPRWEKNKAHVQDFEVDVFGPG